MSDPTAPTDGAGVAQVIQALGALQSSLAYTIVGVVAVIILTVLLIRYLDRRADRKATAAAEYAKRERAIAMRGSWDQLTGTMSRTGAAVEGLTHHIQSFADESAKREESMGKVVAALSASVSDLHASVRDVAARQQGTLTTAASMRLIEDHLRNFFRAEVIDLFTISLKKNDWDNRPDTIRQRMKTNLSDALKRMIEGLHAYALAVSPGEYIAYVVDSGATGSGGVRFTVVDVLWDTVEPLYQHDAGALDHRTEDMRVKVKNVIDDMISRGRKSAEDLLYSTGDHDRDPVGLFRHSETIRALGRAARR